MLFRSTNCRVVLDGRRALSKEQQKCIATQGMRYIFLGDGKRGEAVSLAVYGRGEAGPRPGSVDNENERIEYALSGKRA